MKTGAVNVDVNDALKVGIIVIAGGVVLFLGWRKIKKTVENIGDRLESRDVTKQAGKDVLKSELSYQDSWYIQSADRLMTAFEGWGTKESTIFSIFDSLKTASDWNKLLSEFGTRKGYPGTRLGGSLTGNLVQWLETELNEKEMGKIKDKLLTINVVF